VAHLSLSNKIVKTGSIELPEGVVHIFRECSANTEGSEGSALDDGSTTQGVLLAVLAVPPYMTPSDFLNFVAPAAEGITHLRMIRWTKFQYLFFIADLPQRFLSEPKHGVNKVSRIQ